MPEELKSPLLDDKIKSVPALNYTDDEIKYLNNLQARLEFARNQRDQQHDEFDGMDYLEYWQDNEKGANTFIRPKENKEDTTFQSGTIRQKIFALIASLMNLDLSPDIQCFDENDIKNTQIGQAIEDIIIKAEELDEDEEKKLMRTYELLKQGSVFVEEIWDEKYIKDKVTEGKFHFDGKFRNGLNWTTKIKRLFSRPSRNIIPGVGVYLGDIRQYNFNLQPYVFTVQIKSWSETESLYSKWENWKYVTKRLQTTSEKFPSMLYNNNWRLTDVKEGQVEIIKYQDPWNNEYGLILNGVLMTPIGLPLTAIHGYNGYNIAQQNYEPITPFFAYGKSIVRKLKGKEEIYTELLRLAVLKTQKSFMPPRANLSGRVVTSKIFMPGKITTGIQPNSIPPLDPNEQVGVTNSELAMIQEMKSQIDNESVNPTFQGQQTKGQQTATEILEMQRQARLVLGLTVLSTSWLEYKCGWLRLFNILAKWFEPIDEKVQKLENGRQELKNKYRTINLQKPIQNEGMGRQIIRVSENLPTPQEIYNEEEGIKEQTGEPVRITYLNPHEISLSKWVWQMSITPREKRTSEVNKLLFRAMMADIGVFGRDINWKWLEERFALNWGEDPTKMFNPVTQGLSQTQPVTPETVKTPTEIPGLPAPGAGIKNVLQSTM